MPMTVEAVPLLDDRGEPFGEAAIKSMHTTMQTLGRIALISGVIIVALLNIGMFAHVEALSEAEKITIYGRIYLLALTIPVISIVGVSLVTIHTAETGTPPSCPRHRRGTDRGDAVRTAERDQTQLVDLWR